MARGLIGKDPEQREHVFERLKLSHRHYDKSGIAAIDTALWDLGPGKKYGVPIARLLGGFRERLPVYASTTSGQRTPGGLDSVERYADFAESCQAAGIPAFKIHSFFDGNPQTEIAIMSAVRQRVGQDMKLMTDPAPSLKSFTDAVEVGRACDDLGFFWYDQGRDSLAQCSSPRLHRSAPCRPARRASAHRWLFGHPPSLRGGAQDAHAGDQPSS